MGMAVEIDFEKMMGLAPAIVQDAATGEVLMLRFMKPSISTSPVAASCTIAGASPIIFSKSISTAMPIPFAKTKNPLSLRQRVGGKSAKLLRTDLRRHARHVGMVMMAMDQRSHLTSTLPKSAQICQCDFSGCSGVVRQANLRLLPVGRRLGPRFSRATRAWARLSSRAQHG